MGDLILKWAYRYGGLEVDDYWDTLDAAIRAADSLANDDQESLDCIEVFAEDGSHTVLSRDEVWKMAVLEAKANTKPQPPTAARVWIRGPGRDQDEALYSHYYGVSEATVDYERFHSALGDRVRLEIVEPANA